MLAEGRFTCLNRMVREDLSEQVNADEDGAGA